MTTKSQDIKAGMVVGIYGGTTRVPVTRVRVDLYCVQITDGIRWHGLSHNETVEVKGWFNP